MTRNEEATEAEVPDLDEPIWGAALIAKEVRRSQRQTYDLLAKGRLDASKVGKTYVSTRRRLRASLGTAAA